MAMAQPRTWARWRPFVPRVGTAILYLLLIGLAVVILFPFVWMVLTSLKVESDIAAAPPRLFPRQVSLLAYAQVWDRLPLLTFFRNTVVFAGGVTLASLVCDSLTAYALARLDFPGRTVIFVLILATLMIPVQVTIIPVFIMVYHLGWLNTYAGLIVPRATNAFGIFMLRQFFLTVPRELDQAARIDGCNMFGIYWRIILPLSTSALATLAVLHLMYNWNDLLWPLVMTTSTSMEPLTVGLATLTGQHEYEYAVLMAGATLAVAPLLLAFLSIQRYFIQGIAVTGLKE
ncbi:MAG TPA: carbohydrate ABC transporter permease [Chloroflexota bacterium]|nr:carbohydrate ABC transporter permease [Chloroflexota bacterium]